jgi:Tfp pilus assembly protein PilO
MSAYTGEERRQPEGWHFDKRIPIATLATLLVITVTGTLYIAQIRQDVEVLRESQNALAERVTRQDADNIRAFDRFYGELRQMNEKLDRLIERSK